MGSGGKSHALSDWCSSDCYGHGAFGDRAKKSSVNVEK
jgi:hypothetical protein